MSTSNDLTPEQIGEALAVRLVEIVRSVERTVNRTIDDQRARIEQLQSRLDHAEHRIKKAVCYRGTWHHELSYLPGDAVTHKGSLWQCQEDASGNALVPGQVACWKMMTKFVDCRREDHGKSRQ